ncbi:MAG: tryptophan-rich sensory protein [Chloroflexota bacterium]|nr:MAG: tryptophan-rich sensory protein [Chloroflexota bacterium]
MTKDIIRQLSVVVGLILTIVVNVLSNAIPFNGLTAPEIADSFDVYFVPAGYVFSIWSVIYLGLIAYAVFQLLPAQRENPRLRQTGWWFVLSCAANSIWLFLWHYGYFALSVLAMLTILLSLIYIYLRLGVGRKSVPSGERWLVHLTFSVYLGWITVATIANITAFLDFINWNGFGISPEIWTFIMLVVAVVVAGLMAYSRQDIAYLLVLIWAFVGIGVEQSDTTQIANAAYLAAVIVSTFVIIVIIQKLRQTRKPAMATS